jgi:hypothetical protein
MSYLRYLCLFAYSGVFCFVCRRLVSCVPNVTSFSVFCFVCRRLVSCVPNVTSFSGLFVVVLCLVYPMLPVSLDYLRLVYPMLSVSLCCVLFVVVLCTQCYQFLCVVFCLSSSCVPYVTSFSVLCFVCRRLVYPMLPVSLDCPCGNL